MYYGKNSPVPLFNITLYDPNAISPTPYDGRFEVKLLITALSVDAADLFFTA
jgi:hypothetical protein